MTGNEEMNNDGGRESTSSRGQHRASAAEQPDHPAPAARSTGSHDPPNRQLHAGCGRISSEADSVSRTEWCARARCWGVCERSRF